MRRALLVAAVSSGLATAAPVFAQAPAPPAAERSAEPVQLSGVWWPHQPEGADFKPDPVLTPAAKAVWDEVRGSMAQGKVVLDSTAACVPPGTPRLMTRVYPIQWIRHDKGYVLIHEYANAVRWIFMDGRKAPEGDDVIPTFNGHSVGRWEGDVLVVETTGFKAQSEGGWPVWVQMGVRVTPELKLIERYRLAADGQRLEVKLTLIEPSVFAQPWETAKAFRRRADVDIMEFTCLPDENVVAFKPDGSTTFRDLTE